MPNGEPKAAKVTDGSVEGGTPVPLAMPPSGAYTRPGTAAGPVSSVYAPLASSDTALHDVRLRVLSETGRLLAQSLDYEGTLRSIVQLAVPAIADWASYSVLDSDPPAVRTIALHHHDPTLLAQVEELGRRYPILADNQFGVARVLRTGESELLADVSAEVLAAVAHDDDHLRQLHAIGFRSIAHVPIISRGEVIGALGFGTAESGRRYDAQDVELFEEIAARAALAIENAKLYAAERSAREEAERQRQDAQETARRMRALQQVTAALGEVTLPEQAARVIVEQALLTLEAQAGSVVTLDTSGRTFHTLHSAGYGELAGAFASYPLVPGRPLSDAVLHLRPQYVGSARELEERYPWSAGVLAGSGFEAFVAVPILVGERLLAALSLSFRDARAFDAADRAFVNALAEACAQALTRVELYQAERRARAQAEQANAVKTDFLAVMSHELRTPLNAIMGYTDLLALEISGPLAPQQAEHVSRVKSSATHLLTLIDEILTFAKLDAGRDELDLAWTDPHLVAVEAGELIAPLAEGKGLRLVVQGDEGSTASRLETDAAKLRQILLNLLSNAVKFTDRGEIVVAVRQEEGSASFEVRDTGVGIAPENVERIFEPFWQVEQRRTRRAAGTGLGLSVARRLAHLLGGRLTVSSMPGAGSSFLLSLPLRATASDA